MECFLYRNLVINTRDNMKKASCDLQYRHLDIAVLYMRMFIGCIILLHNVGKLQTYDRIIDSYPSLLFGSPTVTFAVFTICECVFAVMIMIGFWTRFAAFMMTLGMFLSIFVAIPASGMTQATLQFVYMGIFVFFVISGGGRYALDYKLWWYKMSD